MSKFIFIAGPCVIESQGLVEEIAGSLKETVGSFKDWDFYFKASFDKANRSASDSFRGLGIERGLEILAQVRKSIGVKVLTDIHETWQCEPVASVVDALQIPAFLCRQTDLIQTAAKYAKKNSIALNVKKGQFLAPWDMKNVVEKVESVTSESTPQWLWLTERGSAFGYNRLVVDMTALPLMRKHGVPVVFDATHSVQLPGGAADGKTTSGCQEMITPLARAAVAVGVDGLFMETHPNPSQSKSDAANAFPLSEIRTLLQTLQEIRQIK